MTESEGAWNTLIQKTRGNIYFCNTDIYIFMLLYKKKCFVMLCIRSCLYWERNIYILLIQPEQREYLLLCFISCFCDHHVCFCTFMSAFLQFSRYNYMPGNYRFPNHKISLSKCKPLKSGPPTNLQKTECIEQNPLCIKST